MSYKANDLDLRAPYASSPFRQGTSHDDAAGSAAWPPHPDLGRDAPIYIDQTVMACCNAAYDAAAFHGAREVRLEHLLYALTRVDAAREILEQHGLRTSQLRRDAAAAIVEAMPGPGGAPRSSVELETVLRRAAGRAGQDSVPASVQDLLRVLLGYGRDSPSTALLLRSANDPQQLERWGGEPPPALLSGLQPGYAVASLQPAAVQELVGRLDTMEAAMRSLVADVAADRKAMLELMAELRAGRGEDQAAPTADVTQKLEEISRSMTGLGERFEAIRAFAPSEGGGDFSGRLSAMESRLSEQPSAIADAVSFMLNERRAGAEGGLQPAADGGSAAPAEKIVAIEEIVRTQAERMEEASKTHERDLGEIFEALVKLGTNQQTLGNNLEAWRLDSSGDISIVSNRLESLERSLQGPGSIPDAPESNGARARSFKRWLYGTGRVLPSSWREDAAALRDSLRRGEKT